MRHKEQMLEKFPNKDLPALSPPAELSHVLPHRHICCNGMTTGVENNLMKFDFICRCRSMLAQKTKAEKTV